VSFVLWETASKIVSNGRSGCSMGVTGHLCNTLYTPTCFHRNVRNIRSAISAMFTISAISVPISAISVLISEISVAISAMSAISAIFIIPETFVIPAPSTYWPSNQVPDIYPFFILSYLLSLRNVLTLLYSSCI
jgi:hypothetical protein